MRQKFDIGDLVETTVPTAPSEDPKARERGIVIQTEPINKHIKYSTDAKWHPDEYKCKIRFITFPETRWVRAKWLNHVSKIEEQIH